MNEMDEFASSLLEEAKRFLEKAGETDNGSIPHCHAALMLGFCALEAHTNAIADEMALTSGLCLGDLGVLLEKEVKLENGELRLGNFKMYRLEDRILFLYHKFSGTALDRKASWWSELSNATMLRNRLTHPKDTTAISAGDVQRALRSIIDTINALYLAIYKRPFPASTLQLQSRYDF